MYTIEGLGEFKSLKEACKQYGISTETFRLRVIKGISPKLALEQGKHTTEIYIERLGIFKSVAEACRQYGITPAAYTDRIKTGRTPFEALTLKKRAHRRRSVTKRAKRADLYTPHRPISDGIGNHFISIGSMANKYKIQYDKLRKRIHAGVEPIIAAIYKDGDIQNKLRIVYIGINNKAYYSVKWNDNLVTARHIVEYYNPELIKTYDKYNPTGEYKPYRGRSDIE